MQYKIILSLLLAATINIASGQKYAYHPKYITILDTDKEKRCLHQCSRPVPENVVGFYKVDASDSVAFIQNLKKILSNRGVYGERLYKLDDYCYQLLGVMIGKKRFIYINAFYIYGMRYETFAKQRWKIDPVIVCDGGMSAWGVLFDPEKQNFSQFSSNSRL